MNSDGRRSGRVERIQGVPEALGLAPSPDRALFVGPTEELLEPVFGEDGRDLRATPGEPGLDVLLDLGAPDHSGAARVAHRLHMAVSPGGVHDDHRASRVMADPVRDVAQQELLAARHAGVAHDQHVDVLVLGGMHDGHRRVVVDHDVRPATFACDLPHVDLEGICRASGACGLGRAVGRVARVLRQDHLDDMELGLVALGERCSPAHRALGGLGPVGPHHHPLHRPGYVHVGPCHARIMDEEPTAGKGGVRESSGWCHHPHDPPVLGANTPW
jgi:hypothetical protein